jgi:hypothetical protein
MKTINAVIEHVGKEYGHGYGQADDGKSVFINRRLMPENARVGLEVEVGVIERYEAMRLEVVGLQSKAKPVAPPAMSRKPFVQAEAPNAAPRIDASELPRAVAKIVGLIDEPQGRKTKRDRLKEF